ncbi:2-C-methyl-D-erythritol 4-phosphate cytidylyltransferase [Gilliamella sp. Fer1-1]|jgi:2-C-methyl-D-erythritol 4-phosphate cytidylyltransferase|uniref:2-C-methyl-D-erythritol 4-phosphate cytidylyltransferase n=1 Tax=unclassified Gilliamella TaxID=2685620 RepID=UPI00080E2019|nr:2-C-methyl-D-erythritol 4-phosphate cytidylyltransferase [Gilliamella apicola]OCG25183.1 2-C-methyl-D-erythritol 4-phosphate cytidylyltransferase [Gilliamella apicola]OCG27988.1 2-C-methyl-D-erythritol 4-phosphate cytidylyltransferase [Gilliamella apicola]OCG39067.1 2-C-methyl-D-erythritol 4-phosphate cytidylyltransferase [Gilliamella apicola]OCG43127.1 2-C-methyl-D-erythritol 4-phosphate cytidylyltransferase [Gilliamella apicola]
MHNMNNLNNIIAIVPAAGIGCRMNSQIPKQYLKIDSKTILEHTLNKLLTHPQIAKVIVVISPEDNIFSSLSIASHDNISITLGGKTRADSVLAGLQLLNDKQWALVHDAARPCVDHDDISRLIETVINKKQGGILAMRISDTIKRACQDNDTIIDYSEDRTYLWGAATPQLFNAGELKSCLQHALNNHIAITDEASAIEYCGGHPLLIECRRDNIKITRPEDLALANFYLTKQILNR